MLQHPMSKGPLNYIIRGKTSNDKSSTTKAADSFPAIPTLRLTTENALELQDNLETLLLELGGYLSPFFSF